MTADVLISRWIFIWHEFLGTVTCVRTLTEHQQTQKSFRNVNLERNWRTLTVLNVSPPEQPWLSNMAINNVTFRVFAVLLLCSVFFVNCLHLEPREELSLSGIIFFRYGNNIALARLKEDFLVQYFFVWVEAGSMWFVNLCERNTFLQRNIIYLKQLFKTMKLEILAEFDRFKPSHQQELKSCFNETFSVEK